MKHEKWEVMQCSVTLAVVQPRGWSVFHWIVFGGLIDSGDLFTLHKLVSSPSLNVYISVWKKAIHHVRAQNDKPYWDIYFVAMSSLSRKPSGSEEDCAQTQRKYSLRKPSIIYPFVVVLALFGAQFLPRFLPREYYCFGQLLCTRRHQSQKSLQATMTVQWLLTIETTRDFPPFPD